jgi:hypothetical protein
MGHGMETSRHTPPRKRIWLYWVVPVSLVLIVLIGAGAWLGVRGLAAKHALETAQSLIVHLQAKASAKDFKGAAKDAGLIKVQTAKASSYTSDPIWRAAEAVPGVGANLTVVRQLAEVVDQVAQGAIDPASSLLSTFTLDSLKPVHGRINLEPIKKANTLVAVADVSIKHAITRVKAIDRAGTIPEIGAAVGKLERLLTKAAGVTDELHKTLPLLSPMLGGEGVRNYIILFQNNAESESLGGAASAWVVMHVDRGAISITAQPSTNDFPRIYPVVTPIPLDPKLMKLFALPDLGFSNNVSVRPDFPTTGKLAQAFWFNKSGQKVDGVMAFDPIALSYLLDATGPLTLKSGDVLTSGNAVKLLLSDAYVKYPESGAHQTFFADAASIVFSSLTSATPNINKLIAALTRGVNEDRLMIWSDHPAEEAQIANTPLSGILPTKNDVSTEVGVFFNEHSASKMSYYLKTAVELSSTQCQTPTKPGFTAVVSLHSDITPAAEKLLPAYVRSQFYKKPVKTETLVYVYGPPGSTYTGFSYDGRGLGGRLVMTSTDLGRPVALVSIDLTAGQVSSFTAHFTGGPGKYGPLASRVTPMIQPTLVTLTAPGCATRSK